MNTTTRGPLRLLAGVLMVLLVSGTALAQEGDDILAELTEVLALTDEQIPQVQGLLEKFAADMDVATAMTEVEEPDNQAIIGAIKKARADLNSGMKGVLSEEQFQTLETTIDAIFQEIFEDIAEIRLIDLEPVLDLTPEQVEALKPVLGTGMRGMIAVIFEYGDKRLNKRTQIKMGKAMKRVQGDMEQGIAAILNEEQMATYTAMKEEAKG